MNPTSASSLIPNPLFEATSLSLEDRSAPIAPGAKNVTRETAEDFEAFFLSQMFSEMFKGIEVDPVFGGGPAEGVFRSLMIDEYGKSIARSGGVGIADAVMREMLTLQEDQ